MATAVFYLPHPELLKFWRQPQLRVALGLRTFGFDLICHAPRAGLLLSRKDLEDGASLMIEYLLPDVPREAVRQAHVFADGVKVADSIAVVVARLAQATSAAIPTIRGLTEGTLTAAQLASACARDQLTEVQP